MRIRAKLKQGDEIRTIAHSRSEGVHAAKERLET